MSSTEEKTVCKWLKAYDSRSGRNVTVGVMVGVPIDLPSGEKAFNADYAVCNEAFDDFSRELGWNIAYGRAKAARPNRAKASVVDRGKSVWYSNQLNVRSEFEEFCGRCLAYFKDRQPAAKAREILEQMQKTEI